MKKENKEDEDHQVVQSVGSDSIDMALREMAQESQVWSDKAAHILLDDQTTTHCLDPNAVDEEDRALLRPVYAQCNRVIETVLVAIQSACAHVEKAIHQTQQPETDDEKAANTMVSCHAHLRQLWHVANASLVADSLARLVQYVPTTRDCRELTTCPCIDAECDRTHDMATPVDSRSCVGAQKYVEMELHLRATLSNSLGEWLL
jgi:hypothetical protein